MKKESAIKTIRDITQIVDIIMMVIYLILQIFAMEKIRQVILCGVVVMLTIILVALDLIIKDKKYFWEHCGWISIWIAITILAFLIK